MHALENRILQTDLEVAYEKARPYFHLFKQLSILATGACLFEDIHEDWFRDTSGNIDIKISYTVRNETHTIWTTRTSDFINLEVLFLTNKQLKLNNYTFESSTNSGSIFLLMPLSVRI